MTETAGKKPTKKELSVTLGFTSMQGSVWNPSAPGATKSGVAFKLVCPHDAEHPHAVKQQYVCGQGADNWHGTNGDCLKGKEVDGEMVIVPKEEIDSVKNESASDDLDLNAHPYSSDYLLANGVSYVFLPKSPNSLHATFLELVDENGKIDTDDGPMMLIGELCIRKGSSTLVRIAKWDSQLVLQEIMRPTQIQHFETVESETTEKDVRLARQLIAAKAEEFTPKAYDSKIAAELDKLVASHQDGASPVQVKALTTASPVPDLTALLEASLAAAKEPINA